MASNVSLHCCTSSSWGGLELYACTLMVELRRAGTDVLAICRRGSAVDLYLRDHGVERSYLPGSSRLSVASLRFMRRILRERRIDVVHVHFHSDIWLPSIALRNDHARKLFLSVYMGVNSKNDLLHRWVYSRVDGLFTSSEEMNSRLHTLYPVKRERIHFLPYGRRVENYRVDSRMRSSLRSSLGISEDTMLIGTMVRIDPGKGVVDFARSFLYLAPDVRARVRYLIVGEPTRKGLVRGKESPFEPHCEAYLAQLQTYIAGEHLTGQIILAGYQQDTAGYLSAMDIFAFPSRDELYSLVVLDAMAMGLPVVAANAGGNLRQIEDGVRGSLYMNGDSQDLANKLSRYLLDSRLRSNHGRAARRFVETHHSMNATIDTLQRFYRQARV